MSFDIERIRNLYFNKGYIKAAVSDPKIQRLQKINEFAYRRTKFRGEFEDRLKAFMKEIECRPAIILFIDEIHTIVGAQRAEGAVDASNLLKPSLARGELHAIGATTIRGIPALYWKRPRSGKTLPADYGGRAEH